MNNNKYNSTATIKDWPADDRPREKLLKHGAPSLSNAELLAILLRTGTKGRSALDIARNILREFKSYRYMSKCSLSDWKKIPGVGAAKIAELKAALEIGKRFREEEIHSSTVQISSSKDICALLSLRMRDLCKEFFNTVLLNSRNELIEVLTIEKGTVNQAHPIVREIFYSALEKHASSIICAHNHPSGDPSPSLEDKQFTRELTHAGKIMQIPVLDHIIIGADSYYSFADEGKMFK